MEPFTIIQIIASILQLVEFSIKCITKSTKLYRSTDGILDENAASEDAAKHSKALSDKVRDTAFAATHPELRDLCESISAVSSELLGLLEGLKVHGTMTRWKSIRKSVKSVLGNARVQELEQKLSNLQIRLILRLPIVSRYSTCNAFVTRFIDDLPSQLDEPSRTQIASLLESLKKSKKKAKKCEKKAKKCERKMKKWEKKMKKQEKQKRKEKREKKKRLGKRKKEKKRKRSQERSNTVIGAILALRTMHGDLVVSASTARTIFRSLKTS
jgi:hypothetical protein